MDEVTTPRQLERIALIQRAAEQLRNLVTNVLDLPRLEAGPALRLSTLDVAEIAFSALTETRHLAEKERHKLIVDTTPGMQIQVDGTLLQCALVNLLSNAIKYTPPGGTITLQARSYESFAEIAVIDNGLGIPEGALPNLFTRFYRVPGTTAEGTGLGLSIVKSIVEKHNGSIHVISQAGEGSTFFITLPR